MCVCMCVFVRVIRHGLIKTFIKLKSKLLVFIWTTKLIHKLIYSILFNII